MKVEKIKCNENEFGFFCDSCRKEVRDGYILTITVFNSSRLICKDCLEEEVILNFKKIKAVNNHDRTQKK